MNCELCNFKNPKGSTTAVIIQNGRLLLLKRNESPYKDLWDLPGGYMQANETPEAAIRREIKEELNVEVKKLIPIGQFPGKASWQDQDFPVISHAFLVNIEGRIKLNYENIDYTFAAFDSIMVDEIAFDSNQDIFRFIYNKLGLIAGSLKEIDNLIAQLDLTANTNEQFLYEAAFTGYVTMRFNEGKLIGMGWIFPRQTALRRQAIIEDMIVDNNYRGKGIGKAILNDLIIWAQKNGIEVLELTTNPKRIAANDLYKKVGFKLHETNHFLLKI